MTAMGGATVMSISAKTITKPNIVFLTFPSDSAWNTSRIALRGKSRHNPLAGGNSRKVAVGGEKPRWGLGGEAVMHPISFSPDLQDSSGWVVESLQYSRLQYV
jgi:hypothetical protein